MTHLTPNLRPSKTKPCECGGSMKYVEAHYIGEHPYTKDVGARWECENDECQCVCTADDAAMVEADCEEMTPVN